MTLTAAEKLAISSWVNDQFESPTVPTVLDDAPDDVDDYTHWDSDPSSGVTGTVYLAHHHRVYYSAAMTAGTGWWDVGILPPNLRD